MAADVETTSRFDTVTFKGAGAYYQSWLWLACSGRLELNQQLRRYPPAVLDVNALGLGPLPNFR